MTDTKKIIREETIKLAYMDLLKKDEFDFDEWVKFNNDLSAYLRGDIEDIDFITDYYVDYDSLVSYLKKLNYQTKYRDRVRSRKDKYINLYKEFDINEYLNTIKIKVNGKEETPRVIDVYKAFWYLDDGDIIPCNGNMTVAIRGIMRGELSNNSSLYFKP